MASETVGVGFTIGELSRQTSVGIETIRYYERIKLLPSPPRKSGRRLFDEEDYRKLAFIRRCRELGFSLEDTRTLTALRDNNGTCSDVLAVATRHLATIRAKLRDLANLEAVLTQAISRCPNDDSPDCPILQKLETSSCCKTNSPSL